MMFLFFGHVANASIITDKTLITATGQTYSQDFLVSSTGTDVFFSLTAKGDYGKGDNSEYIDFSFDDMNVKLGNITSTGFARIFTETNLSGDYAATENVKFYDYTILYEATIAAADWNIIATDGMLNVSWKNGNGVRPDNIRGGGVGRDRVEYSFTGMSTPTAVPEPSIIALMGLGFFGLGLSRRKMKR